MLFCRFLLRKDKKSVLQVIAKKIFGNIIGDNPKEKSRRTYCFDILNPFLSYSIKYLKDVKILTWKSMIADTFQYTKTTF